MARSLPRACALGCILAPLRGFGSFRTRQRKPRVGRNPKTGERVEVPAKKIPFFKPSKELKDLVNTGGGQAPAPPAPAAPAPA